MFLHARLAQQPQTSDKQKQTEDVNHPVEAMQQRVTADDENGAKDNRSEHTIHQHLVLRDSRHRERSENNYKDEDVVDRQRFLDDVPGEVFEPCIQPAWMEKENAKIEEHREADPHAEPDQRLFHAHDVALSLK